MVACQTGLEYIETQTPPGHFIMLWFIIAPRLTRLARTTVNRSIIKRSCFRFVRITPKLIIECRSEAIRTENKISTLSILLHKHFAIVCKVNMLFIVYTCPSHCLFEKSFSSGDGKFSLFRKSYLLLLKELSLHEREVNCAGNMNREKIVAKELFKLGEGGVNSAGFR